MEDLKSKIIYTITDEAPMLATNSFLPIVKSFVKKAGVNIETMDISLAARVLSAFPEHIDESKRVSNDLLELGQLVKSPDANIIKLPNISASVPQLKSTIKELQLKGYNVPDYPENIITDIDKEVQDRYNKVKGSAVNPVLREGNSDRRAPKSVKNYAKMNPHSMGVWRDDSRTHVATMSEGDFFHNEKSICINNATHVKIKFYGHDGSEITLKDNISILPGEIIDASVMNKKSLISFLRREICHAKDTDILLSIHMKATMMKISDPIIFAHVVRVYFSDLIKKHSLLFDEIGVDFRNGFGDLINKIKFLEDEKRKEIEEDIEMTLNQNAGLAMVDSENNITNLHVPSDVIIDASMPAMIRNSGQMWNKYNEKEDTKAIIPDSSYASIYSATIDFCKKNGAFDPTTMGTVPNVGLMAKKAEEYGSHDKTFEMNASGVVKVIDLEGNELLEHSVEEGDIWRMCQTKDDPIRNWVELAVKRARSTNWPAVFWLDENRSHDIEIIKKVTAYLNELDTRGLDLKILAPYDATIYTLDRVNRGENTLSVTGNVLRDYLTDLFPILELGTSAKMLSIVPLMNGGGLFETGAGGSAPKHVQQFVSEGHLRWDSLGEFLALIESLRHLAEKNKNTKAKILSDTLEIAIENLLTNDKSPKRNVGELDNRGSHFYLSKYWARELSNQSKDLELKNIFALISDKLDSQEDTIVSELNSSQGKREKINGYYFPDKELLGKVMRPSIKFNKIIDSI